MQQRVLLARIGWMKYYCGERPDDPKPVGGGSYNKTHSGSELCNFLPIGQTIYGFACPANPDTNNTINLERIDPACDPNSTQLSNVLVLFVASKNGNSMPGKRHCVVGWYSDASVIGTWQEDPTGKRSNCLYNLRAAKRKAVLLPTAKRTHIVPTGKPGTMGQANVWYPFDKHGSRNPKWLRDVLRFVDEYEGENLVQNPEAELIENVQDVLEVRSGFEPNPEIRRAVEERAMSIVGAHYRKNNYVVRDTHTSKPYDYLCTKGQTIRYVEVKGTRGLGHQVHLTKNEVALARRQSSPTDLCVVHSIKIHGSKPYKASGGSLTIYKDWRPSQFKLRPVAYVCELQRT